MHSSHFYNSSIRRTISVFGTLFNNLHVVKVDAQGNVLNKSKVPLAYGQKQKFLAKIEQDALNKDQSIAIKLPRMGFELNSISYAAERKLKKGQVRTRAHATNADVKVTNAGPVPYRVGLTLHIMAKQQDDALQIMEQILPFFQPDFTVTVKELDGTIKTDMPFNLVAVTPDISYEGDFTSRSTIIYSLDFETFVNFYGPTKNQGLIKQTELSTGIIDANGTNKRLVKRTGIVDPYTAAEDDAWVETVSWEELFE